MHNTVSGPTGTVVQAGDVHDGIHLHAPPLPAPVSPPVVNRGERLSCD
ncbi:hypothetical protein H4696_000322 [Amycolatopsis lexingtonensis]|uniref:Uncharacterized protein n=1 Tax=Amycolatopsis lexingtonensis TaxID=218822 RepID=A0ABR9HR37_9PSEU|nr:hypothetical protein [Amycolatopsis lexingtonensis]MBE1493222.1 hypothetical protein [Amycolatopsis lexingtonensis]